MIFEIPRILYVRIPALKARKVERLRVLRDLLVQAERQEQELADGLRQKPKSEQIRRRMRALDECYAQIRKNTPLEVKPLHFFRPLPPEDHAPKPEEFLHPQAVKRISDQLGPARALLYAHTRSMDSSLLMELQKGDERMGWKKLEREFEKLKSEQRRLEVDTSQLDGWHKVAKKTDSEYAKWKLEQILARAEKKTRQLLRRKLLLQRAHANLLQEQIDRTGHPQDRTKLAELLPEITRTASALRDTVIGRLNHIWNVDQVTQWVRSARRQQIEQLEGHIRRMGG